MFSFLLLCIISILISDAMVKSETKTKMYNTTVDLPHNKTGLLLGTTKYLSNGRLNLYYKYRIDAAVELFKTGKIDYILISGDNSRKEYNEPETMRDDLLKRGIPEAKIVLDYAGFRTLDSVVRSKLIFGQKSITVISQKFHNERAVFIANRKGINAVGYNAKQESAFYGFKTNLREKLARVKVMLDLIFNKQPKFKGEKIEI